MNWHADEYDEFAQDVASAWGSKKLLSMSDMEIRWEVQALGPQSLFGKRAWYSFLQKAADELIKMRNRWSK